MSLVAEVRAELEKWHCPYALSDTEIHAAIFDATRKWENCRESIRVSLKLSDRQVADREPIPDHWIVWDALLILFTPDPFCGPRVYSWSKSMTPEEIRKHNAREVAA